MCGAVGLELWDSQGWRTPPPPPETFPGEMTAPPPNTSQRVDPQEGQECQLQKADWPCKEGGKGHSTKGASTAMKGDLAANASLFLAGSVMEKYKQITLPSSSDGDHGDPQEECASPSSASPLDVYSDCGFTKLDVDGKGSPKTPDTASQKTSNIQVYIRARPFSERCEKLCCATSAKIREPHCDGTSQAQMQNSAVQPFCFALLGRKSRDPSSK